MKGSTEVSYDQTTGKLRQTILKENGVTEQMIKIVSTWKWAFMRSATLP